MVPIVLAAALAQIEVRTSYDANRKVAGHIADSTSIRRAKEWNGRAAPDISTKDAQGKPVSLNSLKGRPVLIFFLDKACPCCVGARVYIDRIQTAYPKTARVMGFLNGTAVQTKAWIKKNSPKFRVVPDPDNKVGIAYRAEVGMACRLLDKSGKIVLSYPGYSTVVLQNLDEGLAKLLGVRPKGIKTFPAPEDLTSGCPLIR